ncbi:MAG: cupin domain-containing protein [Clostridium sp.]|nr:cupin domain-containing protein [Clostridium sp.]
MVEVEGLAGGKGKAIVKHLLNKEQFNGKARLYAKITLKTGCSVGYHEHHNESETYFILSGKGQYNDNGKIRTVLPGDVTFTGDGMGHGIENVDTEDLVFIGLILL